MVMHGRVRLRYAAGQKEKTRSRIIRAAGRVFRREGYHAAGVDKVMAEAGLTAGASVHFDSNSAPGRGLEDAALEAGERLVPATENLAGRQWIEAFLSRYLNREHCKRAPTAVARWRRWFRRGWQVSPSRRVSRR